MVDQLQCAANVWWLISAALFPEHIVLDPIPYLALMMTAIAPQELSPTLA